VISRGGILFYLSGMVSPAVDLEVAADAAGSLGFGAYFNGLWSVGSWDKSEVFQSIAYKELFPHRHCSPLVGVRVEQTACVISLRQCCCGTHSQFKDL